MFSSTPLLFGLTAVLVSALGLAATFVRADWTRAHAPLFAVFAGSLILTVALTRLMPEVLEHSRFAVIYIVLGIAIGFGLSGVLKHWFGHTAPALASVIVIAVHSSLDGGVYALTLSHDSHSGFSIITGLIVHEFPEVVMCFVLLQRIGLSNAQAGLFAFAAAGLTTFAGTLIATPLVEHNAHHDLTVLIALTIGFLIFVGLNQFLHLPRETPLKTGLPPVLAGFTLALLTSVLHPSHMHEGHDGLALDHAPSWSSCQNCDPE